MDGAGRQIGVATDGSGNVESLLTSSQAKALGDSEGRTDKKRGAPAAHSA